MKKIIIILVIVGFWFSWDKINQKDYSKLAEGQVVLYSTDWCGYCEKTRQLLAEHNVKYVEYDIEKSNKAKRDYDKLNGNGVPLMLIGKKVIRGYSEERVLRALDRLE